MWIISNYTMGFKSSHLFIILFTPSILLIFPSNNTSNFVARTGHIFSLSFEAHKQGGPPEVEDF